MVRPDKNVPTERLMRVLGIANGAGITHYGIAAQQPAAPQGE
jgi:biopolymer transport protein ExbD